MDLRNKIESRKKCRIAEAGSLSLERTTKSSRWRVTVHPGSRAAVAAAFFGKIRVLAKFIGFMRLDQHDFANGSGIGQLMCGKTTFILLKCRHRNQFTAAAGESLFNLGQILQ